MSGAAILTAGKAVLFFGLPLAFAFYELWKLRRMDDED